MKKVRLFLAAVLILSVFFTACSNGQSSSSVAASGNAFADATSTGEDGKLVIGFCDMATDEPGVIYQNYFIEYITALGCTPVVLASDSNAEKQITQIEDMVTMGVDAIFIRPVSNDSIGVALQACADAGIPVIGENFVADTENVRVFVTAQSHYAYGVAQAEQMSTLLEADPDLVMNVGYLMMMQGFAPAQQRRDGFLETIQPYIDEGRVEILDVQSLEGDFSKLLSVVEDWRTSYPQMNAFVCANDDRADRMGETTENALFTFVAEGGGAAFYHASAWVDPAWPDEYKRLVGGTLSIQYGSRRSPMGDFMVQTRRDRDGITQYMPDCWMTVEDDLFAGIEWHPKADTEILATVFDKIDAYKVPTFPPPHHPVDIPGGKLENMPDVDKDAPVAWVNRYGKGRVFVTTLGHCEGTIKRPGFMSLFIRGMEWAATGKATIAPPDRSGDRRLRPWPFY